MENVKNKNSFLITWGVCIVLLLVLCFFGTNSNSVMKGTSAANLSGEYYCPSGTTPVEVFDNNNKSTGEYACCPSGYTTAAHVGSFDGTYWCQNKTTTYYSTANDPGCTIKISKEDYELITNNINPMYCSYGYTERSDGYLDCDLPDWGVAYDYDDEEVTFDDEEVQKKYEELIANEIRFTYNGEEYISSGNCTRFSSVTAEKRSCYFEPSGSGNTFHWIGETEAKNKGIQNNTAVANSKFECLAKTNSGYLCIAAKNGVSSYKWVNNFTSYTNYDNYVFDLSVSSQTACQNKNACYRYKQHSGADWTYFWGYSQNLTNLEKVSSIKNESDCLDAGKETPSLSISKNSFAMDKNDNDTFKIFSSVAGKVTVTSGNTSVATVYSSSSDITATTNIDVTVIGIGVGTSTLTIKLTPTDTTKYKEVTKTLTVTVSDSSSGGGTTTKTNPTVTLTPTSLSVGKGKTNTFTVESNVAGTITVTSGSTDKATVTPSTTSLSANGTIFSSTVTVRGVAKGSSTITIVFKPTDTTKYNEVTKTLNATVTDSSSSGGGGSQDYTYTATFDANGGTLKGSSTLTCISQVSTQCTLDSSFTLPNATRSGYTFKGGDEDENCTSGKTSNLVMGSTNVTYYACWQANSSGSKKTPTLSVDSYKAVLKYPDKQTIGYTYVGDGTVTCDSADTSIATCMVSDGKLIITPTAEGNTKVTLKASEGTNYEAIEKQVAVQVTKSTGDDDEDIENPKTGEITIAIIWFVGIFAVAYAFFYYRKSQEN